MRLFGYASWEYDHIIESLHLLNYVDCPMFRKNVHRALNRGESYHQLRRAISHANFGKLRYSRGHRREAQLARAQKQNETRHFKTEYGVVSRNPRKFRHANSSLPPRRRKSLGYVAPTPSGKTS